MTPKLWRPQAITLDLDDTLWPIGPTLIAAERMLADWLREHAPATAATHHPEARAALRQRVLAAHPEHAHDLGFLRRESLRLALADAGEDPALADAGFELFLAARQQVTLFDDVRPVLARWATRYRLVAVSNGNASIHATGLGDYFSAAVSAHEFGCAKPDPRIFHEACRLAGAAPDQVLHIGDDLRLDVHGAQAAGLQAAWVRRPGAPELPAAQREGTLPPVHASLHEIDARLAP